MTHPKLPRITDVADLSGKKVLVRASLNVPIHEGKVLDRFRLTRGLATINYLVEQGAKVIVISHIGREPEQSLLPVFHVLRESVPLTFTNDLLGPETIKCIDAMQSGEVVLLENLRRDPREQENDADFAKALADFGDLYVNDDFPVAHREQASVVGIPKYLPSYAGINFALEFEELCKTIKPEMPALFLLGGAKFETKLPLVEKLLDRYDHIFIGGALAHDFFKVKGYELGSSLVSDEDMSLEHLLENEKILLPIDVTVESGVGTRVCKPAEVQPNERIVDAGPETTRLLAQHISVAKTILWNGPFGDYEHGFDEQTLATAQLVADALGYSVLGGGDTVAAIAKLNLQEKFNFLSTAGGAMLTFLEHETLPGIDAILAAKHEA